MKKINEFFNDIDFEPNELLKKYVNTTKNGKKIGDYEISEHYLTDESNEECSFFEYIELCIEKGWSNNLNEFEAIKLAVDKAIENGNLRRENEKKIMSKKQKVKEQTQKIDTQFEIAIKNQPEYSNIFSFVKDDMLESLHKQDGDFLTSNGDFFDVGYVFSNLMNDVFENIFAYIILELRNHYDYSIDDLKKYDNYISRRENLSEEEEVDLEEFAEDLFLVEGEYNMRKTINWQNMNLNIPRKQEWNRALKIIEKNNPLAKWKDNKKLTDLSVAANWDSYEDETVLIIDDNIVTCSFIEDVRFKTYEMYQIL
ncbi:hypothetical protein LB941_11535 [Ligilactobacillus sp. WILCCON 0076]|uniref:Uncharacterized protein n=1 Tax=Ligilactobacillus ubinensis TaxID=2876789 RepID=A0A9X2FRZ6_9LACO|nr:hypothetical protein [Ligilactobacillus ubinensis]MCP0887963.1 hypothetical protein [Ligilactobacillus ubinensis]